MQCGLRERARHCGGALREAGRCGTGGRGAGGGRGLLAACRHVRGLLQLPLPGKLRSFERFWSACSYLTSAVSSCGRAVDSTGSVMQEDDAAQIVTYPREVEGVVRKTDDRRKLARKRKAERLEAAAGERLAEVKRLKNLKRTELDERLAEVKRISGHQGNAGLSALVEGDFEPEAYDAAMAAAFGADYYQVLQPLLSAFKQAVHRCIIVPSCHGGVTYPSWQVAPQGEDEHDAVMDEGLARELAEIDDHVDVTDALSLARQNAAEAAARGAPLCQHHTSLQRLQ